MSIIYVLLTISVIVALVFFAAFIFSVRAGQYDDTYTPSVRMLFEDELIKDQNSQTVQNQKPINNQEKQETLCN
ncbi:MAG: cbb3-type cytochrome oxidase assembly protein CcoS [Altibacter sp.]|uniref:cbb3-type cytochrome oxidase assembly protein CcoS n=1 Tax=Altibacter sp. TaxID=2024823 RepID=UPI001E0881C6|nr:cbb3-type cytochrome oxidase assembly protein CcoS [Altibacter sp.]MBZ0328035.1 cbb3-type cytochrome oxidase assembly protein CcoS [Altibacter sp.]